MQEIKLPKFYSNKEIALQECENFTKHLKKDLYIVTSYYGVTIKRSQYTVLQRRDIVSEESTNVEKIQYKPNFNVNVNA